MINRRDAIKGMGAIAGAASLSKLFACSSSSPVGIKNYVYLMMENRSYDHVFGARKLVEGNMDGDGLTAAMTNPNTAGMAIAPYVPSMGPEECVMDPDHSWDGSRAEWNMGACDGFVKQQESQYGAGHNEPMQYLTRDLMPVSYALADAYTTCDNWFCSVMGPTWPNRFYWMCGTSGGIMTNELPSSSSSVNFPTIFNSLHDAKVDWSYYYGSIPVVSALDNAGPYQIDVTKNVKRMDQFFTDAMKGQLSPVTYIDPAFYQNDDHPPIHPINGQALIASVYTALAASPQWKNCLLIVTYDEHGGFHDHVSPPTVQGDALAAQGFNQLGFRVPTIVIGPYVKQGYVSHVQYEHCSALKQLETAFGLSPSLNDRVDGATDLSDCIDTDALMKGKWNKPIASDDFPMIDPSTWQMGTACDYTGARVPAHDPITQWADKYPERIAGLDLRGELPEYERAIKDFLRNTRIR